MTQLSELKALYLADNCKRYPNLPPAVRSFPKWTGRTANGLTKMICDYINLSGGRAYRINTQGQYDAKLKKWRYSGMRRGLPDIQAVVNSKFVGIEVKINFDRQSEHQKKIQSEIESAQGSYFIATSFEQFFTWYNEQFTPGSIRAKQEIDEK